MRRRSPVALALLSWAVCLATAATAYAQRVLLVEPPARDPLLEEAFNRLRGELTASGFEVVVEPGAGADPARLALLAESQQSVAAVSFVRSAGATTVDLWISDRVTGKTILRTLSTSDRGGAARALAIRAVDLLRASLREYGADERPPPDVVGAHPERAPAPIRAWAGTAPPRWGARLEAAGFLPLAESAPGSGVVAGVEYGFTQALWLRALFGARLGGASLTYGDARAELRHEHGSLELAFQPWHAERVGVEAALGAGALRLSVTGSASGDYAARSDEAWTAALSAGLGLSVKLGAETRLSLTGRWLALAPRPVVHLAGGARPLDGGMVAISSGLLVRF